MSYITPTAHETLINALDRLAVTDGLHVKEIAARCILKQIEPKTPAYSPDVIEAHKQLMGRQ
jgi:hypothetical protein